MKLAGRISALRHQKGISQEELADHPGVSRQAVSKWEPGAVRAGNGHDHPEERLF